MESSTRAGSDRRRLWLAALKPPMYSVAIMPILLGTAVAYAATRQLNWVTFLTFLGSAVLILVWENLSNDVFDSDTGIDCNKHHSLVNLTGRRSLIFGLGNLCLAAGILGVFSISLTQGSAVVLGLILVCCFLGYLYQGPPFRLGYLGLGELLCFPCFGPLGVGAAYYSQTGSFSWVAFWASLSLGLTTSLVLFCSHFHQVKDDIAAGKRSPIVRLGTARSAAVIPIWCGVSLILMTLPALLGIFPLWTLLSLLSLPIVVEISRFIGRYHDQPQRVINCKFLAIKFQFWSGLLFCLGFWLG